MMPPAVVTVDDAVYSVNPRGVAADAQREADSETVNPANREALAGEVARAAVFPAFRDQAIEISGVGFGPEKNAEAIGNPVIEGVRIANIQRNGCIANGERCA